MNMSFIQEMKWRNMIKDITPYTEEHFDKELTSGYIGFDPTATSLHIGNLAAIMMLKHLQICGHKPIILLGGFTGMIGDPAGKSAERKFLSEEDVFRNQQALKKQMENFLDFNCEKNFAEIVNNDTWLKEISLKEFFRDIGKLISVNRMLDKDSVKNRLGSESGLSFTEFAYQVFQAYDFYWLYENKKCKLQMGGSDQWGNITGGLEIIRRKTGNEAFALTCPLITKPDGGKFGKTEEGNIWLDPKITSPYKFYQYWLNVDDGLLGTLLRTFTLFNKQKIEELEEEAKVNPNLVKKILAEDLTTRVHSSSEYTKVSQASNLLFGKSTFEDFERTDVETLEYLFEDLPQTEIPRSELSSKNIIEVVSAAYSISKSETRRLIQQAGITVNEKALSLKESLLSDFTLIKNRYLLLRRGKAYGIVKVLN